MIAADQLPYLLNQSVVRYSSAGQSQLSYSNTVITPLIGPIMQAVKQSDVQRVVVGQTITYSVEISNSGEGAGQVVLRDPAPPGTSFITNSALLNGFPIPGGDPATGIPVGLIEPGTTALVTFQVIVVSLPADLQIVNMAQLTTSFITSDGRTITTTTDSNVNSIAVNSTQIAVAKQANTAVTFVGDTLTYTVFVRNTGATYAYNTLIQDDLPAGTAFLPGSVTVDEEYLPDADPATGIPIGTLAPGQSTQTLFRVRVTGPGNTSLTNSAVVTCSVNGVVETYTTNPVTVEVVEASVAIAKTVNLSQATPGNLLQYQITVRNSSPFAVTATVTDALPPGTTLVPRSVRVNGTELPGAQPGNGIPLGELPPFAQGEIRFQVTVTPYPGLGTPISQLDNQARLQIAYRLPDGRMVRQSTTSNSAVTELLLPIIQVAAMVNPTVSELGGWVQLTTRLENVGNLAANTRLTQLVPAHMSLISGTVLLNGNPVPDLAPGGEISLGRVEPFVPYTVTFQAVINLGTPLRRIRNHVLAPYEYGMNQQIYVSEAISNDYVILIEDPDE